MKSTNPLNPEMRVLLTLLRTALIPSQAKLVSFLDTFSENTDAPDWQIVYRQASQQGVLAMAWDGLQLLRKQGTISDRFLPERKIRLQWAYNVSQIEERYKRQRLLATELADIYAKAGIRTIVLKGIAVSELYPIPEHRPCGDLDCFLLGEYELGNRLAGQHGATVELDSYKHSHINYKGLIIENHQFCTSIRGGRRSRQIERELQRLLAGQPQSFIGETHLESPSALFNAIFLTVHAWTHFLSEGISLRHLCDWTMLLKAHGAEIDWAQFRTITEARDRGMVVFAGCMTRLSQRYLGIGCNVPVFNSGARDEDSLLNDILYGRSAVYNTQESAWRQRVHVACNFLKGSWKFRAFSESNVLTHTLRTIRAFVFERVPKL